METQHQRPQIAAHEVTKVSSIQSIFPIARELKPHLLLVVINQAICVLVLCVGASIPFFLKYITEEVMKGEIRTLLWAPPAVFFLMSLLAVGHMFRGLLSQYISIKISQSLQRRIFSHFLTEEIQEHSHRSIGEKMSRLTYDIDWFVQGTSVFLSETLFLPLVLLGCSAIMIHLHWQLALLTIIICPLGLIAAKPFSKFLRTSSMALQNHYALVSRHILDSLKGLLLIKVFAREKVETRQLNELLNTFLHLNVKNSLWAGLFRSALAIGNSLVICLVFWIALYFLAEKQSLDVPALVAFASVLFFFSGEVSKLGGVMNTLTKASVSVERIFNLLNEKRETMTTGSHIASFDKSIEFDGVYFSYNDQPVLKNISLSIQKGERIALMGMSGAGKTTLINLMLGLIHNQEGVISFDGVNIKDLNPEKLKSLFGYSPQLSVLFYMNIADNIAYSTPGANMDDIISAAKVACAHDFIMELPDGYQTMIGEDGANLSEGQRQRLALARSVLRAAPIIVLDESSAHVDLLTERKIFRNIMALPNKTVILVSHRPSVLREADRIFSISENQVIDVGSFKDYQNNVPHQELLKTMEFVH